MWGVECMGMVIAKKEIWETMGYFLWVFLTIYTEKLNSLEISWRGHQEEIFFLLFSRLFLELIWPIRIFLYIRESSGVDLGLDFLQML